MRKEEQRSCVKEKGKRNRTDKEIRERKRKGERAGEGMKRKEERWGATR